MSRSLQKRLDKVYIISEIGINHQGDMDEAKKLIRASVEAKADAVKVQARDLEKIYTKETLKDPLSAEHGTQYLLNQLRKTFLDYSQIEELYNFTSQFNIDFIGTPFDSNSAYFLNKLGIPYFKIGSPDFSNIPLIKLVSSFKKPIILSTGMCEEDELIQVINFLKEENAEFALLHCNSTYPASTVDINLNFIPHLKEISGAPVGYSGHEKGFSPSLAAVALGSKIIERHITSDTTQEGPDHSASLTPELFKEMVTQIRIIEESLGSSAKSINQGELMNRLALGKSLVYSRDIDKQEIVSVDDLSVKSPAKGISPLRVDEFLGKKVNRNIREGEYLFEKHFQSSNSVISNDSSFNIPNTWGIVGRINDFEDYLNMKPDLVEIHLTWRDLVEFDIDKFLLNSKLHDQDLVIHAPEYYKDKLIDFTTSESGVREYSLEMLSKTLDLARKLTPYFKKVDKAKGPRVVVHPGGHFDTKANSLDRNKTDQYDSLGENLLSVDSTDVNLLVENMPPYPWYFGGQWFNTILLDPNEIRDFSDKTGLGVCYDLSHAQLYCNSVNLTLDKFTKLIKPNIEYLHIADAKGTTQEGLQLGYGILDFDHLHAILDELDVGFVPEIWKGHLNNGEGFKEALKTIENLLKKKITGHHDNDLSNHSHEHY